MIAKKETLLEKLKVTIFYSIITIVILKEFRFSKAVAHIDFVLFSLHRDDIERFL